MPAKKPILKLSASRELTMPICPKCKSMRILSTGKLIYGISGSPPIHECRDCHFSAERFPEVSIKDLKKSAVKKRSVRKR